MTQTTLSEAAINVAVVSTDAAKSAPFVFNSVSAKRYSGKREEGEEVAEGNNSHSEPLKHCKEYLSHSNLFPASQTQQTFL